MKKYTSFLLVALISSLAVLVACQSAKNATTGKMLKFNLDNNKGYDYEMTMNMDQEIMGQQIKMDITTYYSMNVQNEVEGIKNIESTIDRFKLNSAIAGMNIDVDTDKPVTADSADLKANPMLALNKVLGAIKGQKFTMKVNPEGKIVEVKGFETMADNLGNSLGLDPAEKSKMIQEFKGQFNEKEIQQSLERFWYIFPNKEVKVGDSWQKITEMTGKTPGKYISNYKVKDIEGDMVTLNEITKITAKEGEAVSMSGDVTGTLVIDSRSGLVVTADQTMNMKASASGMSFDIKGTSKIKGKARQ